MYNHNHVVVVKLSKTMYNHNIVVVVKLSKTMCGVDIDPTKLMYVP